MNNTKNPDKITNNPILNTQNTQKTQFNKPKQKNKKLQPKINYLIKNSNSL